MYRQYGRALRRRGRPPQRNPKGRGLLRRGFVERLARIPRYGPRPSPAHVTKSLWRSGFQLALTCSYFPFPRPGFGAGA